MALRPFLIGRRALSGEKIKPAPAPVARGPIAPSSANVFLDVKPGGIAALPHAFRAKV
jgi:hypothetical protein